MSYILEREDIRIDSNLPVSCTRTYNEELEEKDVVVNQEAYNDYKPTKLQFTISGDTSNINIKLTIPYANKLEDIHAKHASVFRYHPTQEQWMKVDTTLNKEKKTLECQSHLLGVYCVFVNHYWYSSFTQRMAEEYPNWTKIRRDKESNGQLFLNYFGIKLEEVEEYLQWVQDQKYIHRADIQMLDWVYAYDLPNVDSSYVLRFEHGLNPVREIPQLETIRDFFYNDTDQGGIVDYIDNKFYSTTKYNNVVLKVIKEIDPDKSLENQKFETYELKPYDYHIWNTFDEFGMLLGVKRLHLEKNADFKERILDVFRYPANSSDLGLTHGIARELNLIHRLQWKNDFQNLILKNVSEKIIDPRTILVDGHPLKPDEFQIDLLHNVIIYAQNTGKIREVSFIYGIQKFELHRRDDEQLHRLLFHPDGQSTSKMLAWVEYINTVAPVMWDRFNWDEGFWDTIDKDLTGLGYVPNIWDSDIECWKDYTFNPKRWESESIWR